MTDIDLVHWAANLQVVDCWRTNSTGWTVDRVLWDVNASGTRAPAHAPAKWWVLHGTAGVNTLRYWGTGGSINNGTYTMANYLMPHNQTVYADGRARDTRYTVFKMAPDGARCNHAGECINPITNSNSIGIEFESRQNGSGDIEIEQYIKGALVYCEASARFGIPDHGVVSHGVVADRPTGRRTDPFSGPFAYDLFWSLVRAIRQEPTIWVMWGLPQPT